MGKRSLFGLAYQNKRVFVTGHRGFKGSWLTLWLQQLGATVIGYSLDNSSEPSHWDLLNLEMEDYSGDVRDYTHLAQTIQRAKPDIIFHLAAQPLVRRSYHQPLDTWSTNVMGTVHVLEAARHCKSVEAVVVVTTDKVYENKHWPWGYRENDALGGHDPYSSSKAASECVAMSYQRSFEGPLIATARAGNVIGGGDWSEDRLIPDLIRSTPNPLLVRSPSATRPWQHVLDCLSGYLLLGQKLLSGEGEGAWNFGPDQKDNRSVLEVLDLMRQSWSTLSWECSKSEHALHEAQILYLDSSKARQFLGWAPLWSLGKAVEKTAEWYQAWLTEGTLLTQTQLEDYFACTEELISCP